MYAKARNREGRHEGISLLRIFLRALAPSRTYVEFGCDRAMQGRAEEYLRTRVWDSSHASHIGAISTLSIQCTTPLDAVFSECTMLASSTITLLPIPLTTSLGPASVGICPLVCSKASKSIRPLSRWYRTKLTNSA